MKALTLKTDKRGVATLTFDLPKEKVNKFSRAVMAELKKITARLAEDTKTKVLVVKSAKKNVFIAGADITELAEIKTREEGELVAREGQSVFQAFAQLPMPTVAVIDGACLGGGLEFALACTYRVVTDNEKTKLGCPEVLLGIVPGWGGTQRLPRLVGLRQGMTMILTGKAVNGLKAVKIGLADAYVSSEFVDDQTENFVNMKLSGKQPPAQKKRRDIVAYLLEHTPVGQNLVFKGAHKTVMSKSRGHYPAPLRAIKLIRTTWGGPLNTGLIEEAIALGELVITPECRHLVKLFFINEDLKKDTGVDGPVTCKKFHHAAVLGAGVMGGGIAWLFSNSDMPVRLKDIEWKAVGKGYATAKEYYGQLEKRHKLRPRKTNLKMHHIAGCVDYSGFEHVDVVVEAIVENMEIKKKVLAELENEISKDTIICSNTSSLEVTEMAKALKHPERFVGLHFFNPVNRMPLVEVIPGKKTSAETVASVVSLAKQLGKTPIVVNDCAGFLVNRILLAYMNEAVLMAERGASMTRIDRLLLDYGMPMGPFALADEVGLDICYHVTGILGKAYSDRMKPSELLEIMFKKHELLGKKSGKGFYIHSGKNKDPNPQVDEAVARLLESKHVDPETPSDLDIVYGCMLTMINEASRCIEEGIISKPEYLDMAMIMGAGFPPFRGGLLRYADEMGLGKVEADLKILAERHGGRFAPTAAISSMAKGGGTFYPTRNGHQKGTKRKQSPKGTASVKGGAK